MPDNPRRDMFIMAAVKAIAPSMMPIQFDRLAKEAVSLGDKLMAETDKTNPPSEGSAGAETPE